MNKETKRNSDTKKLRELIERATTASMDAGDDLDAETASLRRGWLQLGKLIEEEMGICEAPVGTEHVRMPRPAARRRPAWPLWAATSVASLLVAAGIALAVHFLGAHEPQKNLLQVAGNDERPKPLAVPKPPVPKKLPQAVQASPLVQPQRHIAESDAHLQWGDSMDEEISAVGEATIYAKQDVFAQSSGVLEIETGLDELTKEVEQGSL